MPTILSSDLVSTVHGITRVGQDLVTQPPAPHNSPCTLQLTTVKSVLSISLFFFLMSPLYLGIPADPFA